MKRYQVELDDATALALERMGGPQANLLIRRAITEKIRQGNALFSRLQEGYQVRKEEDRYIMDAFRSADRESWAS